MKDDTVSNIGHRRGRKPLGPHDQRSYGARRHKRLTQAFLAEAGLDTPTEGQIGLARRAAAATIELEAMEEAQAAGQSLPRLEYTRISGTLRRHRKSLGLDEGASPLLNGDAGPGPEPSGVTSLPSLRERMFPNDKPWPQALAGSVWFSHILKEACRVECCESGPYFGTPARDPYPEAPSREESRRVAACVHKYEDPFDGGPAPDWFPKHLHEIFPKADFLEAEARRMVEDKIYSPFIVSPSPDREQRREYMKSREDREQ